MKKIFEEVTLGSLTVKNRLVRSATFEGGAENGVITPFLTDLQEGLAKGGVGLIITGMMAIGPNAGIKSSMVRVDSEEFITKYAEIAEAIHRYGSKVVIQLNHCGAKAEAGLNPLGPSDIDGRAKGMTTDDIKAVVADFGKAAKRCREAGADGVQIHGAHGYLISQFLSPYYNKRNDAYGGSIENRARFLFAVYDEIRAQVGDAYPVLIKINYSDLVENGLTGDECVWVCKQLEKRGIDAIELSSGIGLGKESRPAQINGGEGYFAEGALRLAEEVKTPVITVGGYRTPKSIEEFLNKGNISAVSLCRPLIREPGLPAKWQAGDISAALCISCNKCFEVPQLSCAFNN